MFQNITPITKNIIILNVIVFILADAYSTILYQYLAAFFLHLLILNLGKSSHTCLCTEVLCIAFNMLTLQVLVRFRAVLGEKKFLFYIFFLV